MALAPVKPASRTLNIKYAVRDIVVLANQVAATGKEMLYLNIGDPNKYDFVIPDFVVDATVKALKENQCGYAPSSGTPAAIASIRAEAARKGIQGVQDVFVTTGASEAIEVCMTSLLEPGDDILTPAPGYPLYTAIVAKLGAVENPYYLDESKGWAPDVDDIVSKITPRTKALVVINPNNPTGALYSKETLAELMAVAKAHNLVVFADEIYDKLIFDGETHTSMAALDPEVSCITFNGLSKSYLGPGVRIGWGIVSGQEELLSEYVAAINRILRARLSANHPFQHAIPAALDGDQGHLPGILEKLQRRRDLTVSMLNEIDGISCVAPQGAFYAFPRLEDVKKDWDWVTSLIQETGVVVVPGAGFGQRPETSHFRVVFLPDDRTLSAAYEQIASFHRRWKMNA